MPHNVAFSGAPLAARPLQELVGPQLPLVPALFATFAYDKLELHAFRLAPKRFGLKRGTKIDYPYLAGD